MPFVAEVGDSVQTHGEMTLEWKIRDFLSLPDKVDDEYRSPVFTFAGTSWYLSLYPNGDTSDSSGHVSLYLTKNDSNPPQTIHYTFGIKSSAGIEKKVENICEFSEKDQGWGFGEFWSRSELKTEKSLFLPDNALTVTCDLKSGELCSVEGDNKLAKCLLSMLESGDDSDVTIKVQGKEFPAHRGILRARSSVFRSMFAHDMLEKQSNVVDIEDGELETFPDFLNHIYSGSCEQISAKNVYSLYTAADKYDVGELKKACTNFMKRNVNIACFFDIIIFALKYGDKELIECSTNFFCDNTEAVAGTAEWQVFLKENLTVGNELFLKAVSKLRNK